MVGGVTLPKVSSEALPLEIRHGRTHLFTVRLWVEAITNEHAEVRGRSQHVLSGEVRYFRNWRELITFFDVMLQELESQHSEIENDLGSLSSK